MQPEIQWRWQDGGAFSGTGDTLLGYKVPNPWGGSSGYDYYIAISLLPDGKGGYVGGTWTFDGSLHAVWVSARVASKGSLFRITLTRGPSSTDPPTGTLSLWWQDGMGWPSRTWFGAEDPTGQTVYNGGEYTIDVSAVGIIGWFKDGAGTNGSGTQPATRPATGSPTTAPWKELIQGTTLPGQTTWGAWRDQIVAEAAAKSGESIPFQSAFEQATGWLSKSGWGSDSVLGNLGELFGSIWTTMLGVFIQVRGFLDTVHLRDVLALALPMITFILCCIMLYDTLCEFFGAQRVKGK